MSSQNEIFAAPHTVTRSRRAELLGVDSNFCGCTLWLTGLSGAGKTTLSFGVEAELISRGIPSYSLDGDILRQGINKNLGFMPADRTENIRRAGEVCKLFADGGIVALASFISPFKADRRSVRRLHEEAGLRFIECFVATPIETCEARDPKGLYKRARAGLIKGFTGIDGVYEAPENPEIVVGAKGESIFESVRAIIDYLTREGILPSLPGAAASSSEAEQLYVPAGKRDAAAAEAAALPKLAIDAVTRGWVQVLADGWAAPLRGFMREEEFLQTMHFNSLQMPDGSFANQSVPIVCPATAEDKAALEKAPAITLTYSNESVAILRNPAFFDARKEERCARQFGTTSEAHPYARLVHSYGDFLVGGELEVLSKIAWSDGLDQHRLSPQQIREEIARRDADVTYAVQVDRPESLQGMVQLLRSVHQGLLRKGFRKPLLVLHPIGCSRACDVAAESSPDQTALLKELEGLLSPGGSGDKFPLETTLVALFPSPRTYAGPTEAQWHAKARLNAGITHLVVGRDPKSGASFGLGDGRTGVEDVLQTAPGLERMTFHIHNLPLAPSSRVTVV